MNASVLKCRFSRNCAVLSFQNEEHQKHTSGAEAPEDDRVRRFPAQQRASVGDGACRAVSRCAQYHPQGDGDAARERFSGEEPCPSKQGELPACGAASAESVCGLALVSLASGHDGEHHLF